MKRNLEIKAFSTWENKKSGNFYTVIFPVGINTTNGQEGKEIVTYTNVENFHLFLYDHEMAGPPYHRELNEFVEKFEFVRNFE